MPARVPVLLGDEHRLALSIDEVGRLFRRLSEVETIEETIAVDGVLLGILPESREFELKPPGDDAITLKGRISEDPIALRRSRKSSAAKVAVACFRTQEPQWERAICCVRSTSRAAVPRQWQSFPEGVVKGSIRPKQTFVTAPFGPSPSATWPPGHRRRVG